MSVADWFNAKKKESIKGGAKPLKVLDNEEETEALLSTLFSMEENLYNEFDIVDKDDLVLYEECDSLMDDAFATIVNMENEGRNRQALYNVNILIQVVAEYGIKAAEEGNLRALYMVVDLLGYLAREKESDEKYLDYNSKQYWEDSKRTIDRELSALLYNKERTN